VPKNKNLIIIADALVKLVDKKWHTWYFMLVRPIYSDHAIALPPFHRQGTETVAGWRKAFDSADKSVLSRIKAIVCDGHRGLVFEAKWRKWKLQRCHFHLIARIQGRRSKWKLSRHYEEGRRIYKLVNLVLKEKNDLKVLSSLNELEEIGWTNRSPEIRKTLSGFVNHFQDYRTYLRYPKLRLPATSNSAESFIGLVEEVCKRARGFRNINVLKEWIICISKTRGAIKCKEKNIPN
jgi:transposase-like protein